MKLNRVVTAIDDNYLLPLLVTAFSAKKNSVNDFEIIIGYDRNKLSALNREIISTCFEIFEIPYQLKSFNLRPDFMDNSHISATTFVRLLMFDSFGGNVLWLDVDLICLPKWDEIFTEYAEGLQSTLVFGAREFIGAHEWKIASSNNSAIKLMGKDYFNTGVMLINCDLWKANNIPNIWPVLLNDYNKFGFQFSDQCIINYACIDDYKTLPSIYNSLAPNQVRNRIANPRILHFAGGFKPWQFTKRSLRVFFSGLARGDVFQYLDIQGETIEYIESRNEKMGAILFGIASDFAKKKSFYTFIKGVILIKIMHRNLGERFIKYVMRLKNSK